MSRPAALTALCGLLFAGFGVACVVLLGDGTLDGELSVADIALAIGVALLGALVVGSTWSGGEPGFWFSLVCAVGTAAYAAYAVIADDAPDFALAAVVAALVWAALLLLPSSRAFYRRDLAG